MTERLRVTVYDGKYTVIQTDEGMRALRHGEEWRDLTGDGLVLALAQEVEELRQQLDSKNRVCTEWERDMNGTLATLQTERHTKDDLVRACEAAEQCIVDFIDVYKRDCSKLVFDEAVKSLRDDALTKVKAALAKTRRAA